MPMPVYYVYTYLTLFSLSSSILLLFTTAISRGKVKCGLAEMWQGKRISEMSSAEYCTWNPHKNYGFFVDATSLES